MTDFTGFAEKFGALAAREGFSLTPGQTQQFARYAELLEEWNQKMNLTAIRAPEEVAASTSSCAVSAISCAAALALWSFASRSLRSSSMCSRRKIGRAHV